MADANAQQNAAAPLTAEQITKLVQDSVAAAIAPLAQGQQRLNETFAAYEKTSGVRNSRTEYIREKMKDLPSLYQNQLPDSADLVELTRAEQAIRQQYRADHGAAVQAGTAPQAPNIGGDVPNGMKPIHAQAATATAYENVSAALGKETRV